MMKLNALSLLDETAREELADLLAKMAGDAAELMVHATMPVSQDLLRARMTICDEAAAALREVQA